MNKLEEAAGYIRMAQQGWGNENEDTERFLRLGILRAAEHAISEEILAEAKLLPASLLEQFKR